MTSRWYKKLQTRQAMLQAAFTETGDGRSFDALSLREITRAANIAPTTFYRHFQDMDEFGLALVEFAEEIIKQDAQNMREALLADGESVRQSVVTLISAMQDHPEIYRLLLNLRLGPKASLRASSNRVLKSLTESLSISLSILAEKRGRPVAEPAQVAESITSLIWGRAGDIMAPLHQSPENITNALLTGVQLVLNGSEQPPVKMAEAHIA